MLLTYLTQWRLDLGNRSMRNSRSDMVLVDGLFAKFVMRDVKHIDVHEMGLLG